jgi:hypothetical protein
MRFGPPANLGSKEVDHLPGDIHATMQLSVRVVEGGLFGRKGRLPSFNSSSVLIFSSLVLMVLVVQVQLI